MDFKKSAGLFASDIEAWRMGDRARAHRMGSRGRSSREAAKSGPAQRNFLDWR